jgi:hypothetical protein
MQLRQSRHFLWKTSPSPTLSFRMKISRQVKEILLFFIHLDHVCFWEIFTSFEITNNEMPKSTKFVHEFCGLDPLGILALVDTATLSCFNHDFGPCPFYKIYSSRQIFMNPCQEIFKQPAHTFAWPQSPLIIMMETQANSLLSRAFSGRNPFDGGILGHNLLLSRAFWWESLWRWDLGHNLLLSQAFQWESLWRWDLGFYGASGYHGAFSQTLPLFTIGFWLSRSLSHELFLSHGGISAITEPFHEFFFHMVEFWLSRSLSHELFFFTMKF